MIGKVYKHNKTNNVVSIERISQDLMVMYRSPKGRKFEKPIDKFFKLYSEVPKQNPKECRHKWSEVTLLTTSVKYCVLCDKRKD